MRKYINMTIKIAVLLFFAILILYIYKNYIYTKDIYTTYDYI